MTRLLAAAAAAILLLGLAALAIWGSIQLRYERLIYTEATVVPDAPVALVFGAGIARDGRLSPMLQDRMKAAIALYQAGVVRKLLVSGDNRFVDYDEPGRMYDFALARGVPAGDVVRDFAGRRTYDTCYRAGAIFGVERAILVTQRFHLARAIFTCRALGIDAAGFAADDLPYTTRYNRLREMPATLFAWWDVTVVRPLPVLGPHEDLGL